MKKFLLMMIFVLVAAVVPSTFCDPFDPDDQSCLPPPDECTQNPALCQ